LSCRDHSGLSCWALNPGTSILKKDTQHGGFDAQKERRHRQKREMQCAGGGRDWSGAE